MEELDNETRILDPEKPQRRDTWRRIALLNHCSLHVEIDPMHPRSNFQSLRFFGNEKRVGKLWEMWQKVNRDWYVDKKEYVYWKRCINCF